jgi:hypothetical protein
VAVKWISRLVALTRRFEQPIAGALEWVVHSLLHRRLTVIHHLLDSLFLAHEKRLVNILGFHSLACLLEFVSELFLLHLLLLDFLLLAL